MGSGKAQWSGIGPALRGCRLPTSVQDSEHQEPTRIGDPGPVAATEVLRPAFGFAKGVVAPQPRAALCPERPPGGARPSAALRRVQLRNQFSGKVCGRDGPIA